MGRIALLCAKFCKWKLKCPKWQLRRYTKNIRARVDAMARAELI
jgi:hypothetical protein